MSAVPRHPAGRRRPPQSGLRLTADQFFALGETDARVELVDGIVVMSPSPTPPHSRIILEIAGQLRDFVRSGTDKNFLVFADTDVRFSDDLVYQPDISIFRADRIRPNALRLDGPPDLVVEVISPSSLDLDLVTKRDDYERFGVGEYWTVDASSGETRARQRAQGENAFRESVIGGDTLPSIAVPGFVLDLAAVRALVPH